MKARLATAALAALVLASSPTSAQIFGDRWNDPALGAFAQSPLAPQQQRNLARAQNPDGRVHSTNPAHDAYDTQGNYISSDPDPFIRNDLMRDRPDIDD